ncbi:MAG: NifU family protein [Actinobacteria bacterium]|nr:NifU family protein [Actinomycetota bacterium]
MAVRMHAERTADDDVICFVVRNLPLFDFAIGQGGFTRHDPTGLPPELVQLLTTEGLAEIVVHGERVECRRSATGPAWPVLAPRCRDAIAAAVAKADSLRAAQAAVAEGAGMLAASHGGGISISGADSERVTIRLEGACHGCPAAKHTVERVLRGDLDRAGLAEVRIELE